MNLKTKFDLGQVVYNIHRDSIKEWIPCPACESTGKVILKDNQERHCPECYGRLGKTIYKEQAWQVAGQLQIGQIRTETTSLKKTGIFSNIGEYDPSQSIETKESYMCYETGIGSGGVYEVNLLFSTKVEASDECKKRNI
jgi:hypothetical protein